MNLVVRTLVTAAVMTALIGAAHALDPLAWRTIRLPDVYADDWGRALRAMGYLPTWLVLGLIFLLVDLRRRGRLRPPLRDPFTRAVLLVLGPGLAGLLAELGKLTFRRLRPPDWDAGPFAYAFRPLTVDTFSTGDLGLPSSHAAVAFGAMFMLARLHPAAAPVFALLAIGTAWSRVAAGAHSLSDVTAAAALAYAVVAGLWILHRRNLERDARPNA